MKQRRLIVLAGGAILAGVLFFSMRRGSADEDRKMASEPARPSPIDEKLPRPPVEIVDRGESARTRTADPRAEELLDTSGTNWAVVVAIYRDYEAADRRARQMTSVKFKPFVYPDAGQGSKYMVLLASGLGRADAEELRQQAVTGGLPQDTYVTKLGR